jgi:hypothetical protein
MYQRRLIFEVFTLVKIHILVFCVMKRYSLLGVCVSQRLEGQHHTYVQDTICIKAQTVYSSDTSVPVYQTTLCRDCKKISVLDTSSFNRFVRQLNLRSHYTCFYENRKRALLFCLSEVNQILFHNS